ncbi:MAG: DUF302 domain-containing protein [Melioribacteraceae bacterium]|nr:DUF302 domain-containing protein [Melioribacteraceae bacterium]
MSYYFSKTLNINFDEAVEKVTAALKSEGFGILTEIDVKETLKKKIDVDFRPYKILGACNPPFAHEVLLKEDKIGIMLPCNVVVQQFDEGVEIAIVDPLTAMAAVDNPEIADIAAEIQGKLKKVLDLL